MLARGRDGSVSFAGTMLLISVHLPHSRQSFTDFLTPLNELRHFLETRSETKILVGFDANTGVGALVDYCHVGPAVPARRQSRHDLQRASAFHSFLTDFGLCLTNTFVFLISKSINDKLRNGL